MVVASRAENAETRVSELEASLKEADERIETLKQEAAFAKAEASEVSRLTAALAAAEEEAGALRQEAAVAGSLGEVNATLSARNEQLQAEVGGNGSTKNGQNCWL